MAEQLAENYHNTWGRKKKIELQAKGSVHRYFFRDTKFRYIEIVDLNFVHSFRNFHCAFLFTLKEVEHILCWFPMTL